MSKSLILYPVVKDKYPDYSKTKVIVVPNQSMTLKQIIARFLRKEPLPIEKEGFYAEGFGDVEKMAKQDITTIREHGEQLKAKFKSYEAMKKADEEKKKAEADKLEADRLGGSVLTVPQTQAKSGGGTGAPSAPVSS